MTIRLYDKLMHCRCKGQYGNVSGSFDCDGDLSLMVRTVPRNPSGNNLTPLCHKIPKNPRVFVINIEFLVGAKPTDLSSHKRLFLSIRTRFITRFSRLLIISLLICSHVYLLIYASFSSAD